MQRIFGAIVALSSLITVPPMIIAHALGEPSQGAFFDSFVIIGAAGLLLWWPVRHAHYDLRLRDGFLITTSIWVIASLVTAIPFMLAEPYLSYTDAVFEAASGLTTTGATVIQGLDALPRSVLFYRQSLNFLGGMGIVILAVAILPMLKVGGMQLFRAESTGPTRDNKLTPRIAETARALWKVYLGLSLMCALAYWLGGMSLFDAICHAMSTTATGGFSTHDSSFGYWHSPLIDGVAMLFMLLGGINFGMHWYAWRRATISHYQADAELFTFLVIAVIATLVVAANLFLSGHFPTVADALHYGGFQVVSNLTTTGFVTTGYTNWPGLAPLLLVLLGFVGGCAGSTAGGMKVARLQMVVRQGLREIKQLVHPKGQFVVKVGGRRVSESVVISVAGFCTLYLISFLVMTLALAASGLDIVTAFSAIAACLNNTGTGLDGVANHFGSLGDFSVWVCSFAMILGRLEVFTVLVLLTPQFWSE
ncbi:TrkH family potassium uptake protein [Arenimonas oryziterrae]|uniref:TrkH family potassium uptake protein n=1 Tax=Arenimonas oryziterrae TaxID=498055 RepID=UPI001B7F81CE|nr:potassium transporter TrkG [Arenimonas oryziterrae]